MADSRRYTALPRHSRKQAANGLHVPRPEQARSLGDHRDVGA
jgi:hypothetical protein